jgi:hypothetical protein
MSYNTGGLIEATDYNNLVGASNSTTTTQLNAIWGAGTGDMGYGQTVANTAAYSGTIDPTSATGSTEQVTQNVSAVTAQQWGGLLARINAIRQHQGAAAPFSSGDIPTTGDLISVVNNIQTNINACYTNRHAAGALGSQVTGSNFTHVASLSTSNYDQTVTRTVTWSSADQMRYFFNAGGQITFTIVSANNTDGDTRGDTLESWLEGRFNSITLRARSTVYGGTINTGWGTSSGRYNLTGSASTIYNDTPGGIYSLTDSIRLNAQVNGNDNTSTAITFNLRIAISRGTWTSGGTADTQDTDTVNVIHRIDATPPSTTYLTQTWGLPTIS